MKQSKFASTTLTYEMTGRAMDMLYALHGYLVQEESAVKAKKSPRKVRSYRTRFDGGGK